MAGYMIPHLAELIDSFARLPGIGKKSASRMAFHVLNMPENEVENFVNSIKKARESIHCCPICQNLTDKDVCPICSGDNRDKSVICVVESPRDVLVLEKTRDYSGLYHVLHGVLSPSDGIGPDEIRIKELLSRLASGEVKEIIMATNPSIDGEVTASYISRLVKPMGITVSRLAYGIPVGGTLEFTDSVTLAKALEGRRII